MGVGTDRSRTEFQRGFLWFLLVAWIACLAAIGPPVSAQSLSPATINLAKPVGADRGEYRTVTIPARAFVRQVVIYADHASNDRVIYGIEIMYQKRPGTRPVWTPLIGSKKGKRFNSSVNFGTESRVSRVTLWTRRDGPLAGIQFRGPNSSNGVFSRKFDRKQFINVDPGLTFGGLVARTDGEQIFALGIIAIDPSDPASHPAWANNPVVSNTRSASAVQARPPSRPKPRQDPRPSRPVRSGGVASGSNSANDLPTSFGDQGLPTSYGDQTVSSTSQGAGSSNTVSGQTVSPSQGSTQTQPSTFLGRGELRNVAMQPRLGAAAQHGNVWEFERVKIGKNPQNYFRLRNAETGDYLVYDGKGGPRLDTVSKFSAAGVWSIQPVADNNVRLISRLNDAPLHVKGEVLTASAVYSDDLSAHWSIYCANNNTVKSQKPCFAD